jgi:ribosomal protein S18 acetylase RimI-like enzyme
MEDFSIRKASPEDYSLLPAIELAADAIFQKVGMTQLPAPADEAVYADAALVLVSGDPPIGFVRIIELDGLAHLEQLSVHPLHGKRGVGTALLAAAISELQKRRYVGVSLMTFEDVPWNAPFYRKRGFKTLDDRMPALRWLRERERALGMNEMGRRVALYRDLRSMDVREVAEGGASS